MADRSHGRSNAATADQPGLVGRLARWAVAHRGRVAIGWIALLVVAMAASSAAKPHYVNNLSLAGTDSQRATDLLKRDFATQSGDTDQIVLHVRSGRITDAVRCSARGARSRRRRAPRARDRRREPVHPGGRARDLRRRPHGVCDGHVRRARRCAADGRRQPRDRRCPFGRLEQPAGRARRPCDPGGQQAIARCRDRDRARGRHHRPAGDVRLAAGRRPATDHRAARPWHRARTDRDRLEADRHARTSPRSSRPCSVSASGSIMRCSSSHAFASTTAREVICTARSTRQWTRPAARCCLRA